MSPAARKPGRPGGVAWRPVLGFSAGILLLGAAVWVVVREFDAVADAWRQVPDAPLRLIALALLLPLANWALISASFWTLMQRFGHVGLREMAALIGSAWLLNYLPLKPGLLGRVAYHKAVNGIPVRDSARVIVESLALTATCIGLLLLIGLVGDAVAGGTPLILAALLPLPAGAGVTAILRAARPGGAWRWALAWTLRYADVLAWAARYAVVFAILGRTLSATELVLLTAASQIAIAIPFTGNGLGLREWAVGLTSEAAGGIRVLALSADLANRAAELIVAVPLGLAATAWLVRRAGRPSSPKPAQDA